MEEIKVSEITEIKEENLENSNKTKKIEFKVEWVLESAGTSLLEM